MKYDKKILEKLILEQNKSYSSIGKLYGVTGNAIKKIAKGLGIPLPKRRLVNKNETFSHKGFKKTSLVNRINEQEFKNVVINSTTWKEIGTKLGYKNGLSGNVKKAIIFRCSMLGVEIHLKTDESAILTKTKGELFEERKNWQSARSSIQADAKKTFEAFNPNPKCKICGYSNHVEVAHIKSVSEFDDSATIGEINSINNLIGLCPNHHWEFDNGILKI